VEVAGDLRDKVGYITVDVRSYQDALDDRGVILCRQGKVLPNHAHLATDSNIILSNEHQSHFFGEQYRHSVRLITHLHVV
jgi:hypothetical protein